MTHNSVMSGLGYFIRLTLEFRPSLSLAPSASLSAARRADLNAVCFSLFSLRQVLHSLLPFLSKAVFSSLYGCLLGQCVFNWLKNLPFRNMSWTFSLCVPRNKCFGFTQDLLSQVWQTYSPSGIGPLTKRQETLCAPSIFPGPKCTLPYPNVVDLFQFQQSSGLSLSTFCQNFSAYFLGIIKGHYHQRG
jgi:hypothetical protein